MLTSCYVESPITLEKHFIEVDYNAQEIILNADEEILNINYVNTERISARLMRKNMDHKQHKS